MQWVRNPTCHITGAFLVVFSWEVIDKIIFIKYLEKKNQPEGLNSRCFKILFHKRHFKDFAHRHTIAT